MSSIRRLCSRLERSLLSCSSWISHDVCVFEPALCDHIFIISSNWDMKEEASIVFFPLGFSSVFHFYFCFIHLNLFGCEFPAKTSGKNCDVNHPKTSWNSQPMRIGLLPPAPAFLFFFFFHSSHFPFPRAQPCLWGWRGGCTRIYRCSVFGIWVKGQHAGQRWERPFWEIE